MRLHTVLRHIPYLVIPLVAAIVVTVSAKQLGTFFAQDDITFLSIAASGEPPRSLGRLLSTWLPYFVEFKAFQLNPLPYHVVTLAIHLFNVIGVYLVGLALGGTSRTSAAAAFLFGTSSIAFTPLHWVSGIIELLAASCLLIGTQVVLRAKSHGRDLKAFLTLVVAALCKETACAWPFALWISRTSGVRLRILDRTLTGLAITGAIAFAYLTIGERRFDVRQAGAYAIDFSPVHLFRNLTTYAAWSVNVLDPFRDQLAQPDPRAWLIAVPTIGLLFWLARRASAADRLQLQCALAWWLAFVIPVLPLKHHTYLYYLYVPWIGGALALATTGRILLSWVPRPLAIVLGVLVLLGFGTVELRNSAYRATATRDYLPIDRTVREAMLLRHAIAGIAAVPKPVGSRIGFVNPVPRTIGDPQRAVAPDSIHVALIPLEAAMRGGETLALFFPQFRYAGFAKTIPPDWVDVECFYYEQRGWLQDWGRGQSALLRQADVQMNTRRWSEAESTYRQVRALSDTIPEALEGQARALELMGRPDDSRDVAAELRRRWPLQRASTMTR